MRELTVTQTEPELVLSLNGEIDSGNADDFYNEVMAAYAASPCDLVFECAALEFIDSTTLGTFVKILKHVKTDGRKMKLKNLSARLKKLFLICALDTIMEIE